MSVCPRERLCGLLGQSQGPQRSHEGTARGLGDARGRVRPRPGKQVHRRPCSSPPSAVHGLCVCTHTGMYTHAHVHTGTHTHMYTRVRTHARADGHPWGPVGPSPSHKSLHIKHSQGLSKHLPGARPLEIPPSMGSQAAGQGPRVPRERPTSQSPQDPKGHPRSRPPPPGTGARDGEATATWLCRREAAWSQARLAPGGRSLPNTCCLGTCQRQSR